MKGVGALVQKVRVRYAPSPTGYLHVGGLRTYYFNWLYARCHQGTMVLRIEDTDQQRSTPEFERMILEDIRLMGLDYDEGPERGGPFAPYRQSERLSIYAEYVDQLNRAGKIYPCFCSEALLTQKREAALKLGKTPHYDGTCAHLSTGEVNVRFQQGERAGWRFRAPQKTYILQDLVRGTIEFKEGMVGDFFITRTPAQNAQELAARIGMPVYNFCCVIDDHLMEITHVIRGEEHLSNTVRQMMIFDALGWQPPQFAHTAMVLGTDRQKLSKRSGDVAARDYLDKGFLPEAILNFMTLLGWWPPKDFKPQSGHPEVLTQAELSSCFDVGGLQKAPAIFDIQKLRWMNGHYLKNISIEILTKKAKPFFEKVGLSLEGRRERWFKEVLEAVRGEVQILSELPQAASLFFQKSPVLSEEARQVLLANPKSQEVITLFEGALQKCSEEITVENVEAITKEISGATGLKGKALFMPMRASLTGLTHGPELKRVLPILGKAMALRWIAENKMKIG